MLCVFVCVDVCVEAGACVLNCAGRARGRESGDGFVYCVFSAISIFICSPCLSHFYPLSFLFTVPPPPRPVAAAPRPAG